MQAYKISCSWNITYIFVGILHKKQCYSFLLPRSVTAQKMKFSIKDFFSKCNHYSILQHKEHRKEKSSYLKSLNWRFAVVDIFGAGEKTHSTEEVTVFLFQ